MSAPRKPGLMSLEEYYNFTDANPLVRYEYLDGRVVMMTGGSGYHSIISGRIFFVLTSALLASGCEVFKADEERLLRFPGAHGTVGAPLGRVKEPLAQ